MLTVDEIKKGVVRVGNRVMVSDLHNFSFDVKEKCLKRDLIEGLSSYVVENKDSLPIEYTEIEEVFPHLTTTSCQMSFTLIDEKVLRELIEGYRRVSDEKCYSNCKPYYTNKFD